MAPQADAAPPAPFQRLVDGEGQPQPRGLKDADQQMDQAAGEPQGGPGGPIEDLVILAEVGLVIEPGLPQGGDGPPASGEDGAEDQGDDLGPGRSGELAAEGVQDR
jgi:hypothetical protein